jgi:predicted GNAT superfamily acetyltransferase
MIIYLAEIFENPFKAQNAYINFRKITIKENEFFSDFYTWFLYLLGIRKIPIDDL